MMQHFIFVATSLASGSRDISATDLIRIRLDKSVWPLNKYTAHRSRLRTGDKVLFYAASRESVFVGRATLASASYDASLSDRETEVFDYYMKASFRIDLDEAELFEHPVPARPLVEDLSFVKKPRYWGGYFQGGVVAISERDYSLIRRAGLNRQG